MHFGGWHHGTSSITHRLDQAFGHHHAMLLHGSASTATSPLSLAARRWKAVNRSRPTRSALAYAAVHQHARCSGSLLCRPAVDAPSFMRLADNTFGEPTEKINHFARLNRLAKPHGLAVARVTQQKAPDHSGPELNQDELAMQFQFDSDDITSPKASTLLPVTRPSCTDRIG